MSEDLTNIIKIAKKILPVLILAAILPVIYGIFVNPSQIKLFTEASASQELRVWFEPANVILRNGNPADLTLYAEFDGDNETITSIRVAFPQDPNIYLDKKEIYNTKPFKGKIELGQIRVNSGSHGTYELNIPEEGVVITGLDHQVKIVTAPATLMVK